MARRGDGPAVLIAPREYDPDLLDPRARYELLTSLVVPRPIAWIGTRSPEGVANLAPFSYFAALAASPMLVGVSIGHHGGGPKDSLANILSAGEFTISVVDVGHLEVMNASSVTAPAAVDEFAHVGIDPAEAQRVAAPCVADAPAVLECQMDRHVPLDPAPNTLIIGRVVRVQLSADLPLIEGTLFVDSGALRPVGRLYGDAYSIGGDILRLARPPRITRSEDDS